MGGVIARAPRIDGRGAGAEGAAGKPMPGNAVPRLQLAGGFVPTERHGGAHARSGSDEERDLRQGSCRGARTRGAGPMTRGICVRGAGAERARAEPVR